jgi:hypothetical protein
MEQEFEQRGILGRMERGFAVAEFTRAGDPLKLDFGYRLGTNFKFLHAVSLAQRSDRAMLLAARFPQIASGMKAKKGVTPWLTAVVDDELPKREEVDFALDMMQENGIVVASAAEMPRIAEGIRLELRA